MIPLWFLANGALRPVSDDALQVGLESGLPVVGRVDRLPSIYTNPNKDDLDPTFHEYLGTIGISDTFEEFGICRPSARREIKAVSRYSLPIVDKIPTEAEIVKLHQWLDMEFGAAVHGHRIIEFSEVDIQHNTTPGIPYKWFYGTKGEAWSKCFNDIAAFWKYAHRIGTKVLWHNFVKTELLSAVKLDSDNVRSITGPDISYLACTARMFQDFNERLKTCHFKTSSYLGFTKFFGGSDAMAQSMNRCKNKEEGDASKYDARLVNWLRLVIKEYRWGTMREVDRTPENRARIDYYYHESMCSWLVTGLGYVLATDHGLKSGEINTSSDGTLAHFIVIALSYMRLVSDDYDHFKHHVKCALYGDDELISMSDEVVAQFSAEKRAPIYESCGVHFKPEAAVESTDLSGLTFLGGRFHIDPFSGMYIQTPSNPRKILASLLKPQSRQSPGQTLVRAIALLVESYWDLDNRNLIWGFIQWLYLRGVEVDYSADFSTDDFYTPLELTRKRIPTLREIQSLWLGSE